MEEKTIKVVKKKAELYSASAFKGKINEFKSLLENWGCPIVETHDSIVMYGKGFFDVMTNLNLYLNEHIIKDNLNKEHALYALEQLIGDRRNTNALETLINSLVILYDNRDKTSQYIEFKIC